MPLTDKTIKAAKPGVHADMGGLYLKVYPTGRRVFVVRSQAKGEDKMKTIGAYPAMSLAAARRRLDEVRQIEGDHTVNSAFEQYYAHLEKAYVRPEIVYRMFMVDVLPHIGKKPLLQLTRADCTGVLQKIIDRGRPVQANRTFTAMRKALEFFKQRGWMPENPLHDVTRAVIGGKEKAKERNLSFDDLKNLFSLLFNDANNMSSGTRWSLAFITLTGLRASEALSIHPDGRTFTKMQRWHQVPMTPHVRAMLKLKPEMPGDHRVLSHALRRLKQDFTPHDLRRTFASRLSDLGVMPHVIEKLLDHRMEGVMAVYNRAEFWPERIAAQRLWGIKLAALRRRRNEND